MEISERQVAAAVSGVLEAALRPETWNDALHAVAELCGARLGVGIPVDGDALLGYYCHGSDYMWDNYIKGELHLCNSRVERCMPLIANGFMNFLTDTNCYTREEFIKDYYNQYLMRANGAGSFATALMAKRDDALFLISMERDKRADPYTSAELDVMRRLFARLATACDVALRLKMATAASLLDTMGAAGDRLALLSERGTVLRMTPTLEAMMGGGLDVREGRLRAADPADDAALQALVARAGSSMERAEASAALTIGRRRVAPLAVRCLPIMGAAGDFLGLARTLVTIDELAPPSGSEAERRLAGAYGLTPSEARLAIRIAAGEALRSAAAVEGVTYETARTRLKGVFWKTGVSRQAQLAALVVALRGGR